MANKKRRKHPKLPNGFGSIKKLSGNRVNPYAVYPPTEDWDEETGAPKTQRALCYVNDWYAGFYALMEYKNGTFDPNKFSAPEIKDTDSENVIIQKIISAYNSQYRNQASEKTFAEVYQEYFDYKYNRNKTKQYSQSTISATKAAFQNSSMIHEKSFRALKTEDLQAVIDNCTKKHATKEHILNLFNQMYSYADAHDLCDKKYSEHVKINTPDDDIQGVPFSKEELEIIWANSGQNKYLQSILIMIYSGFRMSAYKTLKINFEENYFKGGVKTTAGKDRIVPFCDVITPFIDPSLELFTYNGPRFRNIFKQELAQIGIYDHTPHDCRHTFSWLCDKFNVDNLSKKIMMGHSLGNDVTDLKYGHRTVEDLRKEINKIQRIIN